MRRRGKCRGNSEGLPEKRQVALKQRRETGPPIMVGAPGCVFGQFGPTGTPQCQVFWGQKSHKSGFNPLPYRGQSGPVGGNAGSA